MNDFILENQLNDPVEPPPLPGTYNGTVSGEDFIKFINNPSKGSEEFVPPSPGESIGTDNVPDVAPFPEKGFTKDIPDDDGILTPPKKEVTDTDALEDAETFIDLREFGESNLISYLAEGHFNSFEKYGFGEEHRKRLVKAWSKVLKRYNVNFSPWIEVGIAEFFAHGRIVTIARENYELRKELEQYRNAPKPQANKAEKELRADTKTLWLIDKDGYFMYAKDGKTYLRKNKKINQRKERTGFSEKEVELLYKYNSEELVNNLLKK